MMSKHPVNLLFRLLLELTAIVVFGAWGYHLSDNWTRFMLALLVPLFFAALWGIFAVPGDPSRSGKTVIPTPGKVRLILELLFFSAATGMISALTKPWLAWMFGGIVLIHYIISYDRISWLLNRR
ncbi:MAG: YrdB family protein [Bacteroidales bacterium]